MLNKIGFFQLDNLITNRVPFIFLNFSESLKDWYDALGKMHLQTYEVQLKPEDLTSFLQQKPHTKDTAIVILCNDGKTSEKIYDQLLNLAYTNVYVINGGYQQMVTERQ